jgi:hypothetical protein
VSIDTEILKHVSIVPNVDVTSTSLTMTWGDTSLTFNATNGEHGEQIARSIALALLNAVVERQ